MKVSEAMASRKSIRAFKSDPIELDTLKWLLDKAARAPSGGNLQPWRVYAATGGVRDDLIAAVSKRMAGEGQDHPQYDIYPRELKPEYHERRRKVAYDMYAKLGIARDDKQGRARHMLENFKFFGAPVGLFFALDKQMGPPQWSDVGMFMQSFMLLARERSLHSCAQEIWSLFPQTVAEIMGIPDHEILFSGMSLGYADEEQAVNDLQTVREQVDDFAVFKGFEAT